MEHDGSAAGERAGRGEGCLVVAVRLPVRIVVLVLVVPIRMVWDLVASGGRFVGRTVLLPFGRGLAWLGRVLFALPAAFLWQRALKPFGLGLAWLARTVADGFVHLCRALFVRPSVGLWRYVVVPVGRALARFGRMVMVIPAMWVYARVLTPFGHGCRWLGTGALAVVGAVLYWTLRILLVLPALFLWQWILAPLGRALAVVARETGDALGHAWRAAGRVSRAVGRFFARLLRWTFVEPARWIYLAVLTPVGHLARDAVWRPAARAARSAGRAVRQAASTAAESARQARAEVRRTLFGGPAPAQAPIAASEPRRELGDGEPRTLEKRSEPVPSPSVRG